MSKNLFVDTETGGLSSWKSALIQLSGIVEIDGEEKERFNFFIRPFPKDEITDSALEVGGFTREQVLTGESFEDPKVVYNKFTGMLKKYINKFDKTDKFSLIGYNSHSFDSPFIRRFLTKCGDSFYGSYFSHPSIDTMLIAAYKLMKVRNKLPNFKLMTVAKFMGIELDESKLHDAMYDVEITKKLFEKLDEK